MSFIDLFILLFWYDGEQGNNRCLCLSHIYNVILWMGGVFLPHTYKQTLCKHRTLKYINQH